MNNLPLISVIICSIDAGKFAHATQCYHQVLAGITHEIVGIHNARSLAEGYNRGIRQSVGDILIFSHDDVLILDQKFGEKIVNRLENYDVLGFAGTDHLIGGEWAMTDFPYLHGAVAHALPGNSLLNLTLYGVHHWPIADNIKAIDGLCMITKRSVAQDLCFDAKTFDGFHLYDIDFSFSAHRAGYRVGVCCDIPLIHYSAGSFDVKQRHYARRFVEKHAGHLDPEKYSRDTESKLTGAWLSDPDALKRAWCEDVLRRSTVAMLRRVGLPPHQPTLKILEEPKAATSFAEASPSGAELAPKVSAVSEQQHDNTYQDRVTNHQISSCDLQQLLNQSEPIEYPRLIILLRIPAGTEPLLANTLDSLAVIAPSWQLVAIADMAPPDELRGIDRIHWISPDDALSEIVARIEADWVLEAPAGTRFDNSLFFSLFQVDRSITYAVFADNDYYDNNNQRHSPRLKPGVNPAALMSADLAGPLCVARDKWMQLPARESSPTTWLITLWAIARIHGWRAVKHLPHVLFSLPASARHTPAGLFPALEKELSANAEPPRLQAINAACWSILWPLPSACPRVDILIQTDGDTGLIERCLNSIAEKTDYPTYRVSLLIAHHIDTDIDPDLHHWLRIHQKTHPTSSIWQQGENEALSSFINRVATSLSSDYVLFLADELVALHPDWLTELVRACQAPKVVAASPRLIQPQTGHIENCGYVLGLQGWRGSAHFRQARSQTPDDFDWIDATRDITTLTTSCALIRTEVFRLAGGLNEIDSAIPGLNTGFSLGLADFSLRLHSQGDRLLYVPRANLAGQAEPSPPRRNSIDTLARQTVSDNECFKAFQNRWWPRYASDPYWNRNLSLAERRPQLETEFLADWFLPERILLQPQAPRILAHVIANAQADFRITDALRLLRQQGRINTCIWTQRHDRAARYHSPSELNLLNPDVHIVQNYIQDGAIEALNSWKSLPRKPFTIYALDDVITDIDPSNHFFKNFNSDTRTRLAYALARCDRMVVSTEFLANHYQRFNQDIRVVPNRLEMSKWLHLRPTHRSRGKPRIGWAGGTTHQRDLLLLKEVIGQTQHEADWIFFGMTPPEIAPMLTESYPFIPYEHYPAQLASLDLDIAVAPLADTLFNRGKSNIRLLELGILGLPVVCTDIDPYRNSPACLVKNTTEQWVSALRERIHDAEGRKTEGAAMRKWVLQNYLLENHLDEWLRAHLPN